MKRVARLPGDPIVQVKAGTRWEYVLGGDLQGLSVNSRIRIGRVPPGHVFLLGDNLARANDSRDFGPVPIESVRRRVVYPQRTPTDEASRLIYGAEQG